MFLCNCLAFLMIQRMLEPPLQDYKREILATFLGHISGHISCPIFENLEINIHQLHLGEISASQRILSTEELE